MSFPRPLEDDITIMDVPENRRRNVPKPYPDQQMQNMIDEDPRLDFILTNVSKLLQFNKAIYNTCTELATELSEVKIKLNNMQNNRIPKNEQSAPMRSRSVGKQPFVP